MPLHEQTDAERKWWIGEPGEAFERGLLKHLDEDDAADAIFSVQGLFVPRSVHQQAVARIAEAERLLRAAYADAHAEDVPAAVLAWLNPNNNPTEGATT